ncbi:acyltransferase family protein [Chitinophaga sp. Hz27]|uniref:acyltransferase family protein n=1 Tax=Chitinophaga sp. Hz27 TaxID=3347169 RepID=UPI0035DDEA53
METGTMSAAGLNKKGLQPKQHYEVLDGLRGIAAIVVVLYHFMEMFISDYSKNFAGHGFLAVDFFFCLSGFVIAYAYDSRIATMGLKEFFIARIIRLHPLVLLGTILGLLAFLFDPFLAVPAGYNAGRIIVIFIASALLIPFPVMAERSFNQFGLNAPAWSLFWEYVANIVYATLLYRLNKHILLILAIISAAALCYVGYSAGNLMGGWGKDTWWHGGVRVAYSFLAGMLVYRYQFIIKNKIGFVGISILLLCGLLLPSFKLNALAELLVIIFYFPLIVALGAGCLPGTYAARACNISGKISYPLYMTHYAALFIFLNYYNLYKPDTTQLVIIISCAIPALTAFAFLVMKFYDEPVRKYLTALWKRSR